MDPAARERAALDGHQPRFLLALLQALCRALERAGRDRLGVGLRRELEQDGAAVDLNLAHLLELALEPGRLDEELLEVDLALDQARVFHLVEDLDERGGRAEAAREHRARLEDVTREELPGRRDEAARHHVAVRERREAPVERELWLAERVGHPPGDE